MNKVKFTVLAIVAAFATTAAASDIEFHGYTRAGIGLSSAGGSGVCFHLQNADTDFRLGNECDYVIEPNFEIIMAKLDDKSAWGFHFMPKAYRSWHDSEANTLLDAGQVYFFGNNLPWLANGSIWAGRKYHDRLQLGINDQFLENEDSDGFGFENADLGFGKLSASFGLQSGSAWAFGNDSGINNLRQRIWKVGVSLTGIQTFNKDSSLQIWAGYYGQIRNKDLPDTWAEGGADHQYKHDAGYKAAIYHNLGMGTMGNLFVGFKYDKNSWTAGSEGAPSFTWDNGTLPTDASGRTQWRAFAQWGVNIAAAKTSLDVLAEYRDRKPAKNSDVHNKWMMAGFRTDTQLSGPFRFLLEGGYDWTKTDGTDSISLFKLTPCLAISAGNDPWSRPTFRFFYTYASWNRLGALDDDYHGRGGDAPPATDGSNPGGLFQDKKSGGMFGAQAEGWW